jgi:hypothetical protein
MGFFFTNSILSQIGHYTPYLQIYIWSGSGRESTNAEELVMRGGASGNPRSLKVANLMRDVARELEERNLRRR